MDSSRRRSRLLPSIQQALIVQFVGGVAARTVVELTGASRIATILFYHKLRVLIAKKVAQEAPFLADEVDVDESCFAGVRKDKGGRGGCWENAGVRLAQTERPDLYYHYFKCQVSDIPGYYPQALSARQLRLV